MRGRSRRQSEGRRRYGHVVFRRRGGSSGGSGSSSSGGSTTPPPGDDATTGTTPPRLRRCVAAHAGGEPPSALVHDLPADRRVLLRHEAGHVVGQAPRLDHEQRQHAAALSNLTLRCRSSDSISDFTWHMCCAALSTITTSTIAVKFVSFEELERAAHNSHGGHVMELSLMASAESSFPAMEAANDIQLESTTRRTRGRRTRPTTTRTRQRRPVGLRGRERRSHVPDNDHHGSEVECPSGATSPAARWRRFRIQAPSRRPMQHPSRRRTNATLLLVLCSCSCPARAMAAENDAPRWPYDERPSTRLLATRFRTPRQLLEAMSMCNGSSDCEILHAGPPALRPRDHRLRPRAAGATAARSSRRPSRKIRESRSTTICRRPHSKGSSRTCGPARAAPRRRSCAPLGRGDRLPARVPGLPSRGPGRRREGDEGRRRERSRKRRGPRRALQEELAQRRLRARRSRCCPLPAGRARAVPDTRASATPTTGPFRSPVPTTS